MTSILLIATHLLDVDASSQQIGRDQHSGAAVAEVREDL